MPRRTRLPLFHPLSALAGIAIALVMLLAAASAHAAGGAPISSPATGTLKVQKVAAAGGGERVSLLCAGTANPCQAVGALRSGSRSLGSAAATIPAGQSGALTVKLNRTGQSLMVNRGRVTAKLAISATSAGGSQLQSTRTVKLPVTGAEIVSYARRFTGRPYRYAANGPGRFDCSGFTVYVYRHFGYRLGRTSYTQMRQGRAIRATRLAVGDLVFWAGGSHVGIYTGRRNFISATVHRGIWTYSFSTWRRTQSYTAGRRILS